MPHVHAHIIPRHEGDMDARGGGDKLYELLEGEEGDVGRHLDEAEVQGETADEGKEEKKYNRFPKQRDEDRRPRTMDDMRAEADMLAREIAKDEAGESQGQGSVL